MRVSGARCVIRPNPVHIGSEDIVFHTAHTPARPRACHIGLAADPFDFRQNQPVGSHIRILLDRTHRDGEECEQSIRGRLSEEIWEFVRETDVKVEFVMVGERGVFARGGCKRPFCRMATYRGERIERMKDHFQWMRSSHAFILTHKKRFGYSVIQAAMSGALPVYQEGLFERPAAVQLRHVEYSGALPWKDVLSRIHVGAVRRAVTGFTWEGVAQRIVGALCDYERNPGFYKTREAECEKTPPDKKGKLWKYH